MSEDWINSGKINAEGRGWSNIWVPAPLSRAGQVQKCRAGDNSSSLPLLCQPCSAAWALIRAFKEFSIKPGDFWNVCLVPNGNEGEECLPKLLMNRKCGFLTAAGCCGNNCTVRNALVLLQNEGKAADWHPGDNSWCKQPQCFLTEKKKGIRETYGFLMHQSINCLHFID